MDEDLYETDFYTWTRRPAEHLRAGRLDRADLANIAEEIESRGESQAAALRSAVSTLDRWPARMRAAARAA